MTARSRDSRRIRTGIAWVSAIGALAMVSLATTHPVSAAAVASTPKRDKDALQVADWSSQDWGTFLAHVTVGAGIGAAAGAEGVPAGMALGAAAGALGAAAFYVMDRTPQGPTLRLVPPAGPDKRLD